MNWRLAVAALCVALGASACSGSDEKPSTLPALTSTPTPTAAPSVPPFPATKQGAADFIRLFISRMNLEQSTGQPVLADLYSSECENCERFVVSMRNYWSAGSVVGGLIETQFLTPGLVQGERADVTANVSAAATQIRDRGGKVVKTVPAIKAAVLTYRLRRVGQGWQVIDYQAHT